VFPRTATTDGNDATDCRRRPRGHHQRSLRAHHPTPPQSGNGSSAVGTGSNTWMGAWSPSSHLAGWPKLRVTFRPHLDRHPARPAGRTAGPVGRRVVDRGRDLDLLVDPDAGHPELAIRPATQGPRSVSMPIATLAGSASSPNNSPTSSWNRASPATHDEPHVDRGGDGERPARVVKRWGGRTPTTVPPAEISRCVAVVRARVAGAIHRSHIALRRRALLG
jgi:hypothetical protein